MNLVASEIACATSDLFVDHGPEMSVFIFETLSKTFLILKKAVLPGKLLMCEGHIENKQRNVIFQYCRRMLSQCYDNCMTAKVTCSQCA